MNFFEAYYPRLAKLLNVRTLENWRNKIIKKKAGTLPEKKKRGRKELFPQHLRSKLVSVIQEMGERGVPLNSQICQGITRGFIENEGRLFLKKVLISKGYSHILDPNSEKSFKVSRDWINKLLRDNGLVERKGGHDAQKLPADWESKGLQFQRHLAKDIATYNIPESLVLAADEYGLPLLGTNGKTRVLRGNDFFLLIQSIIGTKSVGVIGADDKRQVTGFPLVAANGAFIGQQIIFAGTTPRCLPKQTFPKSLYSYSKSHWTLLSTLKEFIEKLVAPYIEKTK